MVKTKIVVDPKIMLGKPVIAGTRITVEKILELLAVGETKETIVQNYPFLKKKDVDACLRFAAKLIKDKNGLKTSVSL